MSRQHNVQVTNECYLAYEKKVTKFFNPYFIMCPPLLSPTGQSIIDMMLLFVVTCCVIIYLLYYIIRLCT